MKITGFEKCMHFAHKKLRLKCPLQIQNHFENLTLSLSPNELKMRL